MGRYQETSRLAFESISEETFSQLERDILLHLRMRPSTTEEIELAFSMRHQTVSAAMSRLWHKKNRVRPQTDAAGKRVRRRTTSGRLADVYEAV